MGLQSIQERQTGDDIRITHERTNGGGKTAVFLFALNRYFFIDKPRTESRRPAFGILSPSQAVKYFHTIAHAHTNARNHAHARVIFATFCKSLQMLNLLFTFTMKTANNERTTSRQGKLSRAAARSILGRFTAYFGHITKNRVLSPFYRAFIYSIILYRYIFIELQDTSK